MNLLFFSLVRFIIIISIVNLETYSFTTKEFTFNLTHFEKESLYNF